MNERTFLKQFEQSVDSDRLVELVYDEMVSFCRENKITENAISTHNLEQLADGFVKRGFGVPPNDNTETYRSEEMEQLDQETINALKRIVSEDERSGYTSTIAE